MSCQALFQSASELKHRYHPQLRFNRFAIIMLQSYFATAKATNICLSLLFALQ